MQLDPGIIKGLDWKTVNNIPGATNDYYIQRSMAIGQNPLYYLH